MKEREAPPLAEFVKFRAVGTRVLGRVTKFGTNDNGPFVTLSPALFKRPEDKEGERFDELALGLSADLRSKIDARDVGKMFVVAFVGERGSSKGSPTKLFKVVEVERGEDFLGIIGNDALFPPVTDDPFKDAKQETLPF